MKHEAGNKGRGHLGRHMCLILTGQNWISQLSQDISHWECCHQQGLGCGFQSESTSNVVSQVNWRPHNDGREKYHNAWQWFDGLGFWMGDGWKGSNDSHGRERGVEDMKRWWERGVEWMGLVLRMKWQHHWQPASQLLTTSLRPLADSHNVPNSYDIL